MEIVVLETWKRYAKKPDEDTTGEELYQTFLDSAEEIVKTYLGFDPVSRIYTAQALVGTGLSSLQLKAKPVTALTALSIDGAAQDVADFSIDGERITFKDGSAFPLNSTIIATYTAGYSILSMPALIKLTIMDIASLLSMNAGEQVGVSSVTFDGGNTRQFINYNNFDKQLNRLADIRLVRLAA